MADKSFYAALIIRAKDEASGVMAGVGDAIEKSGRKIGLALAGVGVAGLKMASDIRPLNSQLRVTALTMGLAEGEMRGLATATSNAGFPLKEVTSTFDLLARAGIRDTEELQRLSNVFDTLGDATGEEASSVARMLIPAFNAFGIELQDAGKYSDMFTQLTRNSLVDLGDFANVVEYLAPDISKLGLSIEDAAAIMQALNDKGIQGMRATRLLRSAVSEAAQASGEYEEKQLEVTRAQERLGAATDRVTAAQANGKRVHEEAILQLAAIDQKLGRVVEGSAEWEDLMYQREVVMQRVAQADRDVAQAEEEARGKSAELAAASKALSDLSPTLYERLGLTAEAVDAVKDAQQNATVSTEEFSAAAEQNLGALAKLKAWYDDLTLSATGTLETMEPLFVALSGIGGAVAAASTIAKLAPLFTGIASAAGAAAWQIAASLLPAINALELALTPVLAVVAPIALALAAIAGLSIAAVLSGREKGSQWGAIQERLEAGEITEEEADREAMELLAGPTPGMAAGGNVTRAGMALVGERGPELLALPQGASVSPLNGGGAGSTVINVSLQVGTLTGDRESAEKLLDMIQSGLRQRQRAMLGQAVY